MLSQSENIKNTEIRVRFAPSPTGFLHIGSARTAFFNWLYARKTGGVFILRIEDTDIQRHQEHMIETIINSLKWLNLMWDEGPYVGGNYGPYRQSERTKIYNNFVQKLLKEGRAYRCFCTAEELNKKRKIASKDKKFFKYDKTCLFLSNNEIEEKINNKESFSIRLLIPENKNIHFYDNVYGDININSNNLDDFVIIRSNGLPTYNFAAAIDDYMMKITHIIRGEDHLSNTPKQLLVYDALNLPYPNFTHLPMILSQDGQKLSKRHGSISIESYREEGFLPEAVLNYIALLGWAYDEKTTIFSIQELINKFDLTSINKKPAKFDYEKLLYINGVYIRKSDNEKLVNIIYERFFNSLGESKKEEIIYNLYFSKELSNKKNTDSKSNVSKDKIDLDDNLIFKELVLNKLKKIIPITKKRAKTLNEFEKMISPFFFEVEYSDEIKDYFKNKNQEINTTEILNDIIKSLNLIKNEDFLAENIEKKLRKISENYNLDFRKVAEIVRIPIWGKLISPPIFETIEILGKEITIKRLKQYLEGSI